MTIPTAVMTKLDAVNAMLASIGQSPINTLEGTIPQDASTAVLSLDTTLREVLTQGWSFNTDVDFELAPDGNKNILVPASAMWADPMDPTLDYVMRWEGGTPKLYDREKHTFTIEQPVKCRIIWSYDFESIPQVARHYVAMRAGRIFQSQIVGSQILFQFTELHEREAFAAFKRLEKRSKRYNTLKNSAAYIRHRNPVRYG